MLQQNDQRLNWIRKLLTQLTENVLDITYREFYSSERRRPLGVAISNSLLRNRLRFAMYPGNHAVGL